MKVIGGIPWRTCPSAQKPLASDYKKLICGPKAHLSKGIVLMSRRISLPSVGADAALQLSNKRTACRPIS